MLPAPPTNHRRNLNMTTLRCSFRAAVPTRDRRPEETADRDGLQCQTDSPATRRCESLRSRRIVRSSFRTGRPRQIRAGAERDSDSVWHSRDQVEAPESGNRYATAAEQRETISLNNLKKRDAITGLTCRSLLSRKLRHSEKERQPQIVRVRRLTSSRIPQLPVRSQSCALC